MLVAGRRFGKTVLALLWLINEVQRRHEGALAYYVAPYRTMAKAIAWDLLVRMTRGIRRGINHSELTVTLAGGRKIALRGADDPETLEGVGLVACVLDEFGKMKLAAFEKSLRPALADHAGRALICGKPRGHNHLKEFYDRGQDPGRANGWRSWLYTTGQGGFVAASEIAEAKATLPPRVYRQEFEATFEALAGRVYDEFTRRTHVAPHAEIEREYRHGSRWTFARTVIGVDWGLVAPGVMLAVGRTAAGRLVVFAEEYHREVLVSEAGWLAIAKKLRGECAPVERFVADPSEPGNLRALRLALGGSPVVENAVNDVADGIRRVSIKMLRREDGKPGLLISDRCVNLIRELEGYVWREVQGAAIEQPADVDDHACDALRYATQALTAHERAM